MAPSLRFPRLLPFERAPFGAPASRDNPTITSRGFTGQGLACLAASSTSTPLRARFPAPSHPRVVAHARSPSRAAGRCRYPNPLCSDTSRHETAATPGGDSSTARRFGGDPRSSRCHRDVRGDPERPGSSGRSHLASPKPPRRVGTCGPGHAAPSRAEPDSVPRLRMGTPARRILGQGPHHPRFREEERDLPHPRCLPSVRNRQPRGTPEPAAFCRSPSTRTGSFEVPIRSAGGRDEP